MVKRTNYSDKRRIFDYSIGIVGTQPNLWDIQDKNSLGESTFFSAFILRIVRK